MPRSAKRSLWVFLAVVAAALSGCAAKRADYVIVGGGTAGCALAARLCEGLPDAKVVLIERAGPRSSEAELNVRSLRSIRSPFILESSEVTEQWESEPNSGLYGSRTVDILSGRTLGGTSAINGAQFSAPTNEVAAGWGIDGLTESKAGVLYNKVFAQLGAAQPPPDLTQDYIRPEYFDANRAEGVRVIEPPELPTGAGVDSVWLSYLLADDGGRRTDSARGYLDPVLGAGNACAENLELIQGATVTKILLKGSSKALGVEYKTSPSAAVQKVFVKKELVMSAGPYHTPKLLQLSGIGPAELLDDFGIPVIADLPVGKSAQARSVAVILNTYTGVPPSKGSNDSAAATPAAKEQFLAGNGGPLGFARAQINGNFGPPINAWRTSSFITEARGTDPRLFNAACLPNPKSRSTVAINSTDPFDTPKVDTNFFAEEGEAEAMAACLEKERNIVDEMPARFNMTEIFPGDTFGDTPLSNQVRQTARNGFHFVGTCGVGTVLDPEMKVIGFSNLRVVDASAIPGMPPFSGPAGSVYMLAEFMAEKLIEEA